MQRSFVSDIGASGAALLVSVIIPSLRRPDLTRRCLQGLSSQTFCQQQFEIVIVENAAVASSILQAPVPSNVRQILMNANYGTTRSINLALTVSKSEYVLLLNNDVELGPAFLERLVSTLMADRGLGFATGKLLSQSEPDRLDGAGDAMLLGGGAYRLGHRGIEQQQFNVEREVLAGCGAATLFRRATLEGAGGLDEDFFAYLDDIDLCLRVQLKGWKGAYVPAATALHVGSATLGGPTHPHIIRWMTRNQIFLVLKNYPSPVLFRLLPRIAVYQMLWCMLSIKRGTSYPYFLGIGASLFSLFRILRKRRAVMFEKKISNTEFLDLLRQSERQVYEWHMQQSEQDRSTLLKFYFRLFAAASDLN